jgi:enoyl-CoA hydratase/carnithine racemase
MTQPRVTTEIAGGIAHVQLNRTDKMNALDRAMFDAIIAAGEALMDRKDVRCVVLSGTGRAFCAGIDTGAFTEFGALDDNHPLFQRIYGDSNMYQRVCTVWRDLPMPVIAAIHGTCFGGGIQIALGADIRIAHPETKLSVMEVKWGLIPDMGGLYYMPLLMRDDHVRDLTYTGRIVSGEDAAALGLVTRTAADPVAEAMALAHKIASAAPNAMRQAKAVFEGRPAMNRAQTLLAESDRQAAIMRGPQFMEAVMAGMQQRAANFSDDDTL